MEAAQRDEILWELQGHRDRTRREKTVGKVRKGSLVGGLLKGERGRGVPGAALMLPSLGTRPEAWWSEARWCWHEGGSAGGACGSVGSGPLPRDTSQRREGEVWL